MKNLLDVHERLEILETVYDSPIESNFCLMKFTDLDWPSNKDENFFSILKDLALRGPLSLTSLASNYADSNHPFDSVKQTFFRILNGSKHTGNISMQARELVVKEKRLFKLAPLGVLFVISVFHCNRYYNDENNKYFRADDFSYQKDINGILDNLKKHCNYFPLIFDNLDYIKSHEQIDANVIFDILEPSSPFVDQSFYSFLNFKPESEIDSIIPFIFYFSNALKYFSSTNNVIDLKKPILSELKPISKSMMDEMQKQFDACYKINESFFKI